MRRKKSQKTHILKISNVNCSSLQIARKSNKIRIIGLLIKYINDIQYCDCQSLETSTKIRMILVDMVIVTIILFDFRAIDKDGIYSTYWMLIKLKLFLFPLCVLYFSFDFYLYAMVSLFFSPFRA